MESGMFSPNFYFKDNVHLIEQGSAKLASSILATINRNITSPTCGISIIANYTNAVSFSFKDYDFPPLPSPALPNHCSISNNVNNPAPNIIKPVHAKKFDVRHRSGTSNVCNTVVCVRNISVCYNRSSLASHNHNFNVHFQHVSVSPCSRHRNDSCFHNRVNGVKNNKNIRNLSVREDVITNLCSSINSETHKLPHKSVHKSVSRKRRVSRASVGTSSIESNVSISVSHTSV